MAELDASLDWYLRSREAWRQKKWEDEPTIVRGGLAIKGARIFNIPVPLFYLAAETAVRKVDELVDPDGSLFLPEDAPKDEQWRVGAESLARVKRLAKDSKMDVRLPFDSVWLGYGDGIPLPPDEWQIHIGPHVDKFRSEVGPVQGVSILSHFVFQSRGDIDVLEFLVIKGTRVSALSLEPQTAYGTWLHPVNLNFVILPLVVRYINSFQNISSVRDTSSDYSWRYKAAAKKMGIKKPVPPPYYRLILRDEVFDHVASEGHTERASWTLNYRIDVRGHERCYIRKGKLPMDGRNKALLLRRGYRVYEQKEPIQEDRERIYSRFHMKKGQGEWIAIKTVWIDDYMKGPKDKPYVPAIRDVPEDRVV